MEQVADLLPGAPADALRRRSIALLEDLAPVLDRRAREGHVRHCHGDLHLGNICLWRGQPTLFDCLEFDPELATIDVLHDLAFLLMDLWQRGYRDEAALLFNRYLDRTNEEDGLAAVPLFLSLRAAVRAHVEASAARARQGADRSRAVAAAGAYLTAALAFLERQEARLVAVGGLSGTGKSTLAAALAARIGGAPGARWLRSDVLRKRLHGVAPESRLPPAAYAAQESAAVYADLAAAARGTLQAGRSVIVDAVFARQNEREAVAAMAREAGVGFTGLWLEAAPDLLRERVAARRDDASDADLAVLERQLGYDLGDLAGWQRVPAAGPPAEVLAAALRILGDGR
ncbi:MAG: AAA family ATPase, partial [Porphyrobacter sp.]|nr:AAA family ATPase [Porphyrobacter sp.]